MPVQRVPASGGAVLRVTTTGSGLPLVLCHGGPGLWDYLGPLARLLPARFRVYRYDQRGCGRSTGDGPHTVRQFAADLDHVRQATGQPSWWVGGHSWGAELALRYALAYPDRTRGLVYLCGTGIGNGFREPYRAELHRRLGSDLPRWQYLHDKPDLTRAEEHELCLLQWRPDYAPGPAAAEFAAAMWDDDLQVNLRCNTELAADRTRDDAELARRCAELRKPVLIVHGEADPRPVWAPTRWSLPCRTCGGSSSTVPGTFRGLSARPPWLVRYATSWPDGTPGPPQADRRW